MEICNHIDCVLLGLILHRQNQSGPMWKSNKNEICSSQRQVNKSGNHTQPIHVKSPTNTKRKDQNIKQHKSPSLYCSPQRWLSPNTPRKLCILHQSFHPTCPCQQATQHGLKPAIVLSRNHAHLSLRSRTRKSGCSLLANRIFVNSSLSKTFPIIQSYGGHRNN